MIPVYRQSETGRLRELLLSRAVDAQADVTARVEEIIADVRRRGDEALIDCARRFDHAELTAIEVPQSEIEAAYHRADPALIRALQRAAANIRAYHAEQLPRAYVVTPDNGAVMGQRVLPLERVGVYVPGGTAPYPSTVLMNSIPARVAGVRELIMVSPPGADGKIADNILAAAQIAGVDRIFCSGGAQAIAALAYGTQSIPRVDKIVGPGNLYVTTAKRLVYGAVDIDAIAGPSEILIVADAGANPAFVAADLMGQAEHDPFASAVLLTDDAQLIDQVRAQLERQLPTLSRREIIGQSLSRFGAMVLCDSIESAVELANDFAPEHLELMLASPFEWLGRVRNAGSVFLGYHCPEPLGDYYAGPNHVLPTNSTARFFSPLGVESFLRRSSYLYYPESALRAAADDVLTLARSEGLTAHANAVSVRLEGAR
ncbi:histidinol dehydrogenase [Feifania hominis]|uniref:Histidinol dehydrogenase n=1 Tax=Feifania hominis TaxID=2763660 RepID=A0A926DE69_9FIRM|nr:histidinol dehydrogenase [Feifania hominis]MBC8536202.1 histidinol dehydrogenase [Feifania hominis]